MQYRVDSKSGNALSALGFGCMRFPKNLGATDMAKTEQMILQAIEEGINYFDTAYIYGGSEEALGSILAKNKVRSKVFIATKLPLISVKSREDFDKYFSKQLERLQTDYIDYYLMHMLTDRAQWQKLCSWGIEEWIAEKKQKGQIKQIGFSFHGFRDEFLGLLDDYEWDFCQIQYNYSNENYQAGVAGLKKAAQKGLPVIIMEPLLGGRLANGLPQSAIDAFHQADAAKSPAEWAFRWLWNQQEVTVVLSGMNEQSQVAENIRVAGEALPNMLTEQEIKAIQSVIDIFNASYKIPCTGCSYCMPCPKNVNIPACFAAYNSSYSLGTGAGLQQYMMSTGAIADIQSCASLCVKCGACEKHCPQNIPIRDSLEQVKKRMEPFWYRFGIKAARAVLGKGQKNTGKATNNV